MAVNYGPWQHNPVSNYWYRLCLFPPAEVPIPHLLPRSGELGLLVQPRP